ncbi:PadR family transcriptional regulator [Paenibacillus sp. XY044]|uniref:PadR family transcriptional regulator n=1 Tax=Paenibacillus sp. XY044 TaxID=2026089 RepID=UPI000B98648F|nr:PadR family transcriptional regulator [Paenibacillus sp. XY044]OZB96249.1 PadR family transcriptional regulator [Paenibacillus sp. XY044]
MYIDLLILIQIEKSPKHGYEIKKEIQKDLGYLMDVNHNLLYPALRRFTSGGAIIRKRHEQEGRPSQYVYEITDAGRAKIAELINVFTEKDAKHEIEFMIRVSLFDRISRENRLRILDMRKKDLESLLAAIQQRQEQNLAHEMFLNEVLQHTISRVEGEIRWIDELVRKTNNDQ